MRLIIRVSILSALCLFSIQSMGQGYNFSFSSPRYWYPLFVWDTIPITLQIRSANMACVRLSSQWEDLDTTLTINPHEVIKFKLPTGQADLSDTLQLNAITHRLINVESNQPIAVSLYINTQRQIYRGNLSLNNCTDRIRMEATDLLSTANWGDTYHTNFPFRKSKSYRVNQQVLYDGLALQMIGLNTLQPNKIVMSAQDTFFYEKLTILPSMPCGLTGQIDTMPKRFDTLFLPAMNHIDQLTVSYGFTGFKDKNRDRALYGYHSADSLPFGMIIHGEEAAADNVGLYKIIEQAYPSSFAEKNILLPFLPGTDSLLASLKFWRDTAKIKINGVSFDTIYADSTYKFYFDEDVFIESSSEFQAAISTLPGKAVLGFSGNHEYTETFDGTGFHPVSPKHFIKKTLFQPVIPNDGSVEARLSLVLPTTAIGKMIVNGKVPPSNQFTPFLHAPQYSTYHRALSGDSVYILENPDGFMAIHYSRSLDTSGFVGLYSMLLTETIDLGIQPEGRLRWRKHPDSAFRPAGTAVLCEGSSVLEILPPDSRYTTWNYNLPDGSTFKQKIVADAPDTLRFPLDLFQGNYMLFVCDSAGCLDCDSLSIEVLPLDSQVNSIKLADGCDGIYLDGHVSTTGAETREWFINGSKVGSGDRIFYSLEEADFPIEVNFVAANKGCDTVITKSFSEVTGAANITFSNVFTPNGDGQNDCYQMNGDLQFYSDCYSLAIFNRWGKQVWQSDNIEDCWSGEVNGAQAAAGTYFYILKLGKAEHTGHLTLMR